MTIFGNQSFDVPEGLETDTFRLGMLRADDDQLDYDAVMSSPEFLRRWEQADWPSDDFSVADNREDLARHEREHLAGESYTFTVMNPDETECLGCVYFFPTNAPWLQDIDVTTVGETGWHDVEVAVQLWVRTALMNEGVDRQLLDALRSWLADAWDFDGHVFLTNAQVPEQMAMFEAAGLARQVEFTRTKDPAAYYGYC